jgi:hypothetical protein
MRLLLCSLVCNKSRSERIDMDAKFEPHFESHLFRRVQASASSSVTPKHVETFLSVPYLAEYSFFLFFLQLEYSSSNKGHGRLAHGASSLNSEVPR